MYALGNNTKVDVRLPWAVGLPRSVRRFFWSFLHLIARVRLPRHVGAFLLLGLLAVIGLYGAVAGGYGKGVVKHIALMSGFSVQGVEVSGNAHVSEHDVLSALDLDSSASIIDFDAYAARLRLEATPWVRTADVQKMYPNRLRVSVVERAPYVLWQHDGRVDVIGDDGQVVMPFHKGAHDNLPLVAGAGANEAAVQFFAKMQAFPQVQALAQAYVYIGGRRWDVILNNGVRVKLPSAGFEERLQTLLSSGDFAALLKRDITMLDLRFADRMVVALSPEALLRRQATVQRLERLQKARKAGRV